jgi:hypothetical protein
MKKNFYLLLLSVLPLLLPGCFPAKKAIILPEQERAERYEPGARAAAEDRLKNVPEILLKSSNIAKDERSQKHADSAMEPIPGREEALASSEAPPQTPFAIELPDPKYVSHRLTKYTRVLNEWNEMAEDMVALDAGAEWPEQWHECVQGLEYMVAGYGRLKTSCSQAPADGLLPRASIPGRWCKEMYIISKATAGPFLNGVWPPPRPWRLIIWTRMLTLCKPSFNS